MKLAILLAYAYLVGSIPTAYLIARLVKGIDIRKYGSGTVGGSNVYYHVGKYWIVPLGLIDLFVKGASPIWIGHFLLGYPWASLPLAGAGLLAIAGHNWSLYLGFTGGRGIAVAIGVLLALSYRELIAFAAIALAGWVSFRNSGLWVLIAISLLPLWSLLFGEPLTITWFCLGLLGLVVVKRLLANWTPLPEGIPKGKVLLYRLLYDRDVQKREEWIYRVPGEE